MKILISGAGIAGLTTAYWLKKYGHSPTVIEISSRLRDGGYMMDFFGSGWEVAKAMDILGELEKKDHDIGEFVMTKTDGEKMGSFKRRQMKEMLKGKYFTIMRGELEDILYEKVKNDVPIQFGTSIKKIDQDEKGVIVTFEDGKQEEFDLVIGADGYHSKVRKLVFGDEDEFSHFLGYYVAAYIFPRVKKWENNFYSYADVGKMIGFYPIANNQMATFLVFQSNQKDLHKKGDPKKILKEQFCHMPSFVPEVLEGMEKVEHIFFDSVSQIKMPTWSKGRVTLVGDAGACLTLLAGQGATMAMCEAYVLSNELKKSDGDYKTALKNYERILKPIVTKKQEEAHGFAKAFTPNSRLGLWLYNLTVRFIHHDFILKRIFGSFDLKSVFEDVYKMED